MASANIELLSAMAKSLGEIVNEIVFLGGCTVELHLTDPGISPVRVTRDVDGIIEAISYRAFSGFETKLRELGFLNEPDPICRWSKRDLLLDIMPMGGDFLGFGSEWFKEAVENSVTIALEKNIKIRVVTPTYLLATKLSAFFDRGKNDFLGSSDLEDIITLINGREELVDEVRHADHAVKKYISESFEQLNSRPSFIGCLPGHLNADPGREGLVLDRIGNMITHRD